MVVVYHETPVQLCGYIAHTTAYKKLHIYTLFSHHADMITSHAFLIWLATTSLLLCMTLQGIPASGEPPDNFTDTNSLLQGPRDFIEYIDTVVSNGIHRTGSNPQTYTQLPTLTHSIPDDTVMVLQLFRRLDHYLCSFPSLVPTYRSTEFFKCLQKFFYCSELDLETNELVQILSLLATIPRQGAFKDLIPLPLTFSQHARQVLTNVLESQALCSVGCSQHPTTPPPSQLLFSDPSTGVNKSADVGAGGGDPTRVRQHRAATAAPRGQHTSKQYPRIIYPKLHLEHYNALYSFILGIVFFFIFILFFSFIHFWIREVDITFSEFAYDMLYSISYSLYCVVAVLFYGIIYSFDGLRKLFRYAPQPLKSNSLSTPTVQHSTISKFSHHSDNRFRTKVSE
uniref:Putative cytosol aminopeptidase n=1 Tax=Lygus hesperus TaxID=30085 RepID=A0A0A9YHT3_LYGHE